MKSFIPVFIANDGELVDFIKRVKSLGYPIADEDIVMTVNAADGERATEEFSMTLYTAADLLSEKIFDYVHENEFFSVVICTDLVSADLISFFNDAMMQLSEAIGTKIPYAFSTSENFIFKVLKVIRGLVICGPSGVGKTEAAKFLASSPKTNSHFAHIPTVFTGECPVRGNKPSLFGDSNDMVEIEQGEFEVMSKNETTIAVYSDSSPELRLRSIGWKIEDILQAAIDGKIPVLTCDTDQGIAVARTFVNLTKLMISSPVSSVFLRMQAAGLSPPNDKFLSSFCMNLYMVEDMDMIYSPSEAELEDLNLFGQGLLDVVTSGTQKTKKVEV